jgi:hypothetical protein
MAGFPDTQQHSPGVVFLNGEYYGLVWLKTPRTENHWRRRYGGIEENFKMLGSNERGQIGCGRYYCGRVIAGLGTERDGAGTGPVRCTSRVQCGRPDCIDYHTSADRGCIAGECRGVQDWDEIRSLVVGGGGSDNPNGLADNRNFEEFARRVDIDNLIHYYALGMYMANVDWPGNNVEMWRYYPAPDEDVSQLHPHLDGKWRMIGQDIEFGYALWSEGSTPSGTAASQNTLRHLMNRTADPTRPGYGHFNATMQTFMMPSLLQREDMRGKMANAFVDLMEGAFEPTNATAVLNRLRRQIESEHRRMIEGQRRVSEIGRDGGENHWPDWGSVENSHGQIRRFLENRPNEKLRHIESQLGLSRDNRSAVTFTNGTGGSAVMNTRPVGENQTVTGNYYNDTAITITAEPYAGYTVDYWTVGGSRRTGNLITIDISSPITVEVTYTKCPEYMARGNLKITAVKENNEGFIELTNDTGRAVSSSGLFLSDSNNDFLKWAMPDLTVQAGETIRIVCSGNTVHSDFAARTNFNLDFGERLRLSDSNGNVLQLVEVTRMSGNQYQVLGRDGKWRLAPLPASDPASVIEPPATTAAQSTPPNQGNDSPPQTPNQTQPNQQPPIQQGGTGGVTATPSENGVEIRNIPESGSWSVSIPHSREWPPTGGPWGIPNGVEVIYSNGTLTISGNGRHGWGDNWNMTWGYW